MQDRTILGGDTVPARRWLAGLRRIALVAAALLTVAIAAPRADAAGDPEATADKPFTICDEFTRYTPGTLVVTGGTDCE